MGLARGFGLLPAGGRNEDTVGKDPYALLAVAELEDEEPPKDMPEDEESEGGGTFRPDIYTFGITGVYILWSQR